MDKNLGSTQIPLHHHDIDLISVSHNELALYLENKLTSERQAVVAEAVQHPFYQDVIAGMQMMIEDIEAVNSYTELDDYLETARIKSLKELKRTCE